MKTKLTIIKLIVASCTLATTAAFGQATYQWSGGGDGTNLANAANWTPSVALLVVRIQTPASGLAPRLGVSISLILLPAACPGTGFGTSGVHWWLTASLDRFGDLDLPDRQFAKYRL